MKTKSGRVEVSVAHPFDAMLAAIGTESAALVGLFRDTARARFESARRAWPVKTGASRDGLAWFGGLDGDEVVAKVWHDTTSATRYTRYVHIVDKAARRTLRSNERRWKIAKKKARGAKRFALAELLVNPWRRDDEPRLAAAVESRLAAAVEGGT